MRCLLAFLVCAVVGLANYQLTEALQCYVCENCVDGADLKEMQICGELPVEATTQETTIEPSTQKTRSTASRRSTATTRRPTTRRTTAEPEPETEEDYDENEDEDEDARKRNVGARSSRFLEDRTPPEVHPMLELMNAPRQSQPVCFMVKYSVNDTQTTSLGCTSLIKDNIFLTCQSLNRANATMDDCQLCGKNGCNKMFLSENDTDNDWDLPWLSGGEKIELKIVNFLFILLVRKLLN